ncbi:sporulation protein YqfC [Sedimentibacter acidaminivorans]|uniref:Sporulation protein YqfC n=1 Tax=Sedimentibacter acidaminivorans TaxID=913099 RepID=A0ABS4GCN7_9FIRM|nr:YabP/YqfC family sporulation protein [Sedimentibacter acidaminivorans]MBP1925453.1 sporulation protein YqfC [Sedimentibacter acidaminivorans]
MKFNNLRSKLADDLEIPNNVVSDNFDMRIQGNKKVIIENHLGLTVYEKDMVGVKTKEQIIMIKGSKFKIEEINDFKVIIKGLVEEIKINSKE